MSSETKPLVPITLDVAIRVQLSVNYDGLWSWRLMLPSKVEPHFTEWEELPTVSTRYDAEVLAYRRAMTRGT